MTTNVIFNGSQDLVILIFIALKVKTNIELRILTSNKKTFPHRTFNLVGAASNFDATL